MTYTQATLDMCERHVAQGERHITDQRARIARLHALGLPAEDARELLRTFQNMQTAHIEHRDLVKADIVKSEQLTKRK